MKSLKAAAVIAGSLVAAGAAAPSFAYDTADLTPTSLNDAVNTLTKGPIDVMPSSTGRTRWTPRGRALCSTP